MSSPPGKRPRPSYEDCIDGDDVDDAKDTNFVYHGRYEKQRYCNPVTEKAAMDADRKCASVRAQTDGINNTLTAIGNEAKTRQGHDLVENVMSQSTTSKSTTWRYRTQHRDDAIGKLEEEVKKVKSIQLGFDGKKVLKRERYVVNGIFESLDESKSRENVILEVKTFDANVSGADIANYIKGMDREILQKVRVIVADTTNLNTGCIKGVFINLKKFFKEEFQTDIHTVECQIHITELLFRHFS